MKASRWSSTVSSVAMIAAMLVGCFSLTTSPAHAQTLADCESLTSAGDWSAAAEACMRVIQTVLSEWQASAGSYCDTDCDHSLAEVPDPIDTAQMTLAYSHATEDAAIAYVHLGRTVMAQYWMKQAIFNSSLLSAYRGGDPLLRRLSAAAGALHAREVGEGAAIDRRVALYQRAHPVKRIVPRRPARSTCPPMDATVHEQAQVNYPDDARQKGLGDVQVTVKVHLRSDGSVGGAKIATSSGVDSMDAAALQAAQATTFSPARRDCRSVPSDVLYRVNFDPNP